MAINFPDSPAAGDPHTEAGVTWTYDGEKWVSENTAAPAALWTRAGTVLSPTTAGDDVDLGTGDLNLDGDILQGTDTQIIWNQTAETGVTSLPVGVIQIARTADTTLFCNQIGTPIGPIASFLNDGVPAVTISNDAVRIGGTVPTSPNITLRASGGASFNEEFYSYRSGTGTAAIMQWSSDQGGTKSQVAKIGRDGRFYALQTTVGSITSERRLKENINPIDSVTAWETIKSVPYYSYNYIGGDVVCFGPMADEVPPEMVEATDQVDDVGPIRTFNNGMLQARLYVALQTALTRIEALEAEVQALKGGN